MRSSDGGQRENKRVHNSQHQGEFLHNYYTFVSLQDSGHDGIVKIFVALPASCEAINFI